MIHPYRFLLSQFLGKKKEHKKVLSTYARLSGNVYITGN